jgi:hypothetical protein
MQEVSLRSRFLLTRVYVQYAVGWDGPPVPHQHGNIDGPLQDQGVLLEEKACEEFSNSLFVGMQTKETRARRTLVPSDLAVNATCCAGDTTPHPATE